ncbi:oxidoreductase [Mucilaginibacter sp. Bleaf8]|uniref:WD40/YVTN/BNR-like repeat-containing protein n=1 Tax=Mucilaginibacter sp. Bleaf8 TaxID=2834430 RepID=UPI001BD0F32D|nr:YCF48-related protein [Mucilaginibacter sp. Bleaf8]MBS7564656.1 oxidoreductase [Mucilaginibacter sp. Bleaf8]
MAQSVNLIEHGKPCSIRGLSVVDEHITWVSGSKGHIAKSTDGGVTWQWQQVEGFEQADFRDIEAFSDKQAIIMSSGTPALILKTIDGGRSWKTVYRNDDQAYFLDAMAFSADGKTGYILGDPIDNKFLILETNDHGSSWHSFAYLPPAQPQEAAFAASGTCLQLTGSNPTPAFVTGGSSAQFIEYLSSKKSWQAIQLSLAHGKASQGAFSFTHGPDRIIFTGGDYATPNNSDSVTCISPKHPYKNNHQLHLSQQQPAGYQSCVIELSKASYLSTGTSGTNISTDNGETWRLIDNTSFNVCQKAKRGKLVLLAGDKGKIAILKNH